MNKSHKIKPSFNPSSTNTAEEDGESEESEESEDEESAEEEEESKYIA